jgi:hypothetical protein
VSKYSISRISNNKVEDFWINSPQSSVFTHPNVLEEFAKEVHWWAVFKGQEIQCVWPITLNDKRESFLPPFSYWQGPFWTKKGFNHPYHRTLSVTTSVYELFIKHLFLEYGSIKASLHPSLNDIRAFDWWNYNNPNQPKFIIKPKYSAIISNLRNTSESIDKHFRAVRRQEIKKFEKINKDVYFDNHCSEEEFIVLYKKKLKIQKSVTERDLISLLKIIKKGFGWIQSARRKSDSTLCGLILVFNTNEQANLVIHLAQEEFKSEGLTAISIFKAIKTAQEKGLQCFDFNGANSPTRGDDKHSYGAKPILYFDIEYSSR